MTAFRATILRWIIAACAAYAVLQGALMHLAIFGKPGFLWRLALTSGTTALIWSCVGVGAAALAHRLGKRSHTSLVSILIYLLGALGAALAGSVWFFIATTLVSPSGRTGPGFLPLFVSQFDLNIFVYMTVVVGIIAASRRRSAMLMEEKSAVAERDLTATQLQVLGMQLQPHFLFNTLHSIAELVHSNAQAASEMVSRLRELMHRSLGMTSRDSVSLGEELQALDSYIAIQQMRFGDRVSFAVDVDDRLSGFRVPALILQPLVENAIRHGIRADTSTLRIVVEGRRGDGVARIDIFNDGASLMPRWTEGHGLMNTRKRLERFYPDGSAVLSLSQSPDGRTVASIETPLVRPSEVRSVSSPERTPASQKAVAIVAIVLGLWTMWAGIWIAQSEIQQAIIKPQLAPPLRFVVRSALTNAWSWAILTFVVAAIVRRWSISRSRAAVVAYVVPPAAIIAVMMPLRWIAGLGMPGAPLLTQDRVNWAAWDLLAFVMVAVALTFIERTREEKESRLRALHLDAELDAARIDALRWQLRPDFLLGTLDVIGRLATSDPDRADALTTRLGDLLRRLVHNADLDRAAIDREIASFEAYRDGAH